MRGTSSLEEKLSKLFAERAPEASPPDDVWERIVAALPKSALGSDSVDDANIKLLDAGLSERLHLPTGRSWPSLFVGAAAAVLVILLLVTRAGDSHARDV